MSKSVALANDILDHLTGKAAWSAPANLWISLHTGNPGTTGANEVAGGSYARVSTVDTDYDAAAGGTVENATAVTFPQGGGGANVTHFGVWDAASGGAFLRGGSLDSGFTYGATTQPEFAAGNMTFSES